jgi:hypothetical protein
MKKKLSELIEFLSCTFDSTENFFIVFSTIIMTIFCVGFFTLIIAVVFFGPDNPECRYGKLKIGNKLYISDDTVYTILEYRDELGKKHNIIINEDINFAIHEYETINTLECLDDHFRL